MHPPEFAALTPRHAPGFDHIIVVMFENRSFDNVLGHLYSAQEKSADDFDGLAQGAYANPGPDGTPIPAHIYGGSTDAIMQQPQPDPGETNPHVNTQLFSVIDPPSNAHLEDGPIQAPFNSPAEEQAPTNAGFVEDYIVNYRISKRKEPTAKEYSVAMGGFSPDMLPVLSTLAREFGAYDRWFAGVPSQTFCNRSLAGLLRPHPARVADRHAACVGVGALLEDPLSRHGSVLCRCAKRDASGIFLRRTAHGLQPQRHAPAVGGAA
ncbi:alkaline phosphatase family protein [uncultured Microbacterium sp.]|uniref:alkaline phosphatase family protein n=1 Tax=uncultured Microbacterium sp. TaxID=191216 RepID=UPI00262DF59F|nr:alkaline phosphatase family protein [uncultured Microbacterium sp.]